MSGFVYVVTEGVHDVTFLGKLLKIGHGARRIETLDALDEAHRPWLGTFSWPNKVTGRRGEKVQIDRLSVPAPVFYRLDDGRTVVVRNAQGISNLFNTLDRDQESFARIEIIPESIGVVLDSDDAPPAQRFVETTAGLRSLGLATPTKWGEVAAGPPRVGAFSLPEPGVQGTLEDLLVALGDVAYPELMTAARTYASDWYSRAIADVGNREWGDLRKPSGHKKATLGAVSALLKPGKAIQASLEDNRWVSDATKHVPGLRFCVAFLEALLRASGPPLDAVAAVEGDHSGAG